MPVSTPPRYQLSSCKPVSAESFQITVRNNLGRLANLLDLSDWDREELQDMAHIDRVHDRWRELLADPEVKGASIPEWVWNRYAKAATRDCAKASGCL
jgi:hypothetical protein